MRIVNLLTTFGVPIVVAAATSVLTFVVGVRRDRIGLADKYHWDERQRLRELVGRFHARMLEAALDWDRRMCQLYAGNTRYMCPADVRQRDQYFFHSVVFRFLTLLSLARRFEKEAFFINARIARDGELEFLRYAKSFVWVMTHSDITPDDGFPGSDHFLNDAFRSLLDLCEPSEGCASFTWRQYWTLVDQASAPENLDISEASSEQQRLVNGLLRFFKDVSPIEPRRRWDRLVCLHLLTIAFICRFGYSWQRDTLALGKAVDQLDPDGVAATSFVNDGSKLLGLQDKQQFKVVCATVETHCQTTRNAGTTLGPLPPPEPPVLESAPTS